MNLETVADAVYLIDNKEAIDPNDSAYDTVFNNVQGNIAKAFGRDHIDLLLIQFTGTTVEVREWIRKFADERLTSAAEQLRNGGSEDVRAGFYLTAAGYEKLGFPKGKIEGEFGDQDQMSRFTAGMAAAAQDLNDPPASDWERPYRPHSKVPIHAMVLLAVADRRALDAASDGVEKSLAAGGEIGKLLKREKGDVLYNEAGERIEPFGFVDGISQPLFLKPSPGKAGSESDDSYRSRDFTPLSQVLVPDPFAPEGECFGSYLVYRKLEQNVREFNKRIGQMATEIVNHDEKLAEAMVMGRFKNGTPLALYGEEQDPHGKAAWTNDFDYAKDTLGSRCPFHSHVRRVNPRNDDAKSRRIARRGIPYTEGAGKQGLLFLCFQSKIHDQFAYLHRKWANVDFPFAGTGIDPLIGAAGYQQDAAQLWPREWGKDPSIWFDFSGVVTLKGGEFFFAPSIPFLRGPMAPAGT